MAKFSEQRVLRGFRVASAAALGGVLASTTPSRADYDWTGAVSTNWFNAGNWSGGVPTNSMNGSDPSAMIDTISPHPVVVGAAGAQANVMHVGSVGTGALTIQNGGRLDDYGGVIGAYFGATGTVTVEGTGSTWANSGPLFVAVSGTGSLTVRNGGTVSFGEDSSIGSGGGIGTVIVDGAGSNLSGTSSLGLWNGTMIIRNGGSVSNGIGWISQVGGPGVGAVVTVDGPGSRWTNNGDLWVGWMADGSLTIRNGGVVSAPTATLGFQGGQGIVNIGAPLGQPAAAPGTLDTTMVGFWNSLGRLVFNHTGADYIFAPPIVGAGTVYVESGTTILTAASSYTGPTVIDGGKLSVNGSIASSTVTVNPGGTLGGNGVVGDTFVSGGTLSPGNSIGRLTVQGNLSFTAASSYLVELSPTAADRVDVTGTATLGGATVRASFAAGNYVATRYTILNAAGGISGTFGSVVSNLPPAFRTSLAYDANNGYLDLAFSYVAPTGGFSANQQGVGNALTNYFNRSGGIAPVYGGLTAAGLTQASGETATGSQQAGFNAMNQFMGVMTDPFTAGRGFDGPGATGFADEGETANAYVATARNRAGAGHDAFAMMTKAPPRALPFEARWSVWASGFGGSQVTDGNATTGANTATSRIAGVAAGADYWLSSQTVAGFALAGGGTSFNVTGGGTGRSDLFQAGGFVRHTIGSVYLSAAAAYGWQDVTTDRTVSIAGIDHLRARFNASTFSGRIEGGNRFVTSWFGGVGLTPYAAAQLTNIALPAYAESVVSGANTFALAYGANSVTATRSELGLRSDKSFALDEAMLTLRGRAAWAHDFNTGRAAAATFQALPGASFIVNGAAGAQDTALTTASAELKWQNGMSLAGTFEGEFSQATRSYAGKGTARYNW